MRITDLLALCLLIVACQKTQTLENPNRTKEESVDVLFEDDFGIDSVSNKKISKPKPKIRGFESIDGYLTLSIPEIAQYEEVGSKGVFAIGISERQLAIQKRRYGKEDFYIVADDAMYYTYLFDKVLDSLNIPVKRPVSRYLKFKGDEEYIIDLEKEGNKGLFWTFLAFNGKDEPMILNDFVIEDASGLLKYLSISVDNVKRKNAKSTVNPPDSITPTPSRKTHEKLTPSLDDPSIEKQLSVPGDSISVVSLNNRNQQLSGDYN